LLIAKGKKMKRIACLIVVLMVVMPGLALAEEPVYFPDANLKAAVEQELGISNPTPTNMLNLTDLQAAIREIYDLTGIVYAMNLGLLELWNNQITGISPIIGTDEPAVSGFGQPIEFFPKRTNNY